MGRASAVENDFEAFPELDDLLQEIEKEEYDSSFPRKQTVPRQRAAPSEPPSLQVDDTVLIDGLKAAAELNGCLGVIEAWDCETSRWRVRVNGTGEAKRIKADNLTRQENFPSRRLPQTQARVRRKSRSQSRKRRQAEAEAFAFQRGMLVKVVNLEATPHLNGSEATCESWDAQAGRWVVRLVKDGTLKRVRPENLETQESIALRLTGPAGMLVHLDVGREWQVALIKEAIERIRDDYPISEQRLLVDGMELENSEKVSEILEGRAEHDQVLDVTLYRKPVFETITGSSSTAGSETREPEDTQKPVAAMSVPWARIESNLRAAHLPGKAPFGYVSQQGPLLAGKGVGKGPGRFVATRHPELAVGRRLVH